MNVTPTALSLPLFFLRGSRGSMAGKMLLWTGPCSAECRPLCSRDVAVSVCADRAYPLSLATTVTTSYIALEKHRTSQPANKIKRVGEYGLTLLWPKSAGRFAPKAVVCADRAYPLSFATTVTTSYIALEKHRTRTAR